MAESKLKSKKFIGAETVIGALMVLAMDSENKLYFAGLIVVVGVIYEICQTVLDWKGK